MVNKKKHRNRSKFIKTSVNVNPKKILVIKLGGIGDVLLIIPALRALRNKFP